MSTVLVKNFFPLSLFLHTHTLSLSLVLSLSTHTHTHTRTRTHTHTRTRTHTHAVFLSLSFVTKRLYTSVFFNEFYISPLLCVTKLFYPFFIFFERNNCHNQNFCRFFTRFLTDRQKRL